MYWVLSDRMCPASPCRMHACEVSTCMLTGYLKAACSWIFNSISSSFARSNSSCRCSIIEDDGRMDRCSNTWSHLLTLRGTQRHQQSSGRETASRVLCQQLAVRAFQPCNSAFNVRFSQAVAEQHLRSLCSCAKRALPLKEFVLAACACILRQAASSSLMSAFAQSAGTASCAVLGSRRFLLDPAAEHTH